MTLGERLIMGLDSEKIFALTTMRCDMFQHINRMDNNIHYRVYMHVFSKADTSQLVKTVFEEIKNAR